MIEWISVEDGLPKSFEEADYHELDVITKGTGNFIRAEERIPNVVFIDGGFYRFINGVWTHRRSDLILIEDVTHYAHINLPDTKEATQ